MLLTNLFEAFKREVLIHMLLSAPFHTRLDGVPRQWQEHQVGVEVGVGVGIGMECEGTGLKENGKRT